MFDLAKLSVATLLATTAIAVPMSSHHQHLHAHKQRDTTFQITVTNSCSVQKSVGLFQITPSFQMISMSSATELQPGGTTTINAPYNAIGMRLSATANEGTAEQFNPQALFEFGYSSTGSLEGTAYNLSLMIGNPGDTGVAVYPANSQCESKVCTPSNCPADQGWTSPSQDLQGSPADTTCYFGPTNFNVVFCPS